MNIQLAKSAGFCFGVKRACDAVYQALNEGKTLYLIHNTSGESLTLDVSGYGVTSLCDFIGMGEASLKNAILTVGPQTSVILE